MAKLNIAKNVTPEVAAPAVVLSKKERAKAVLADLIKEESRLVEGIFQNFETPGASTKISVRKYPGIPPFEKEMTDGETYKIPLYVARHLNGIDASAGAAGDVKNANIGTCSYPIHGFLAKGDQLPASQLGDKGIPVPLVGIVKRKKRFGFQSLEFGGSAA